MGSTGYSIPASFKEPDDIEATLRTQLSDSGYVVLAQSHDRNARRVGDKWVWYYARTVSRITPRRDNAPDICDAVGVTIGGVILVDITTERIHYAQPPIDANTWTPPPARRTLWIKEMDESMGPCYYSPPPMVKEALSPLTEIEALLWQGKHATFARNWRAKSHIPIETKWRP